MLQEDDELVHQLTVVCLRDCSHWANQDRCSGAHCCLLLPNRSCPWPLVSSPAVLFDVPLTAALLPYLPRRRCRLAAGLSR